MGTWHFLCLSVCLSLPLSRQSPCAFALSLSRPGRRNHVCLAATGAIQMGQAPQVLLWTQTLDSGFCFCLAEDTVGLFPWQDGQRGDGDIEDRGGVRILFYTGLHVFLLCPKVVISYFLYSRQRALGMTTIKFVWQTRIFLRVKWTLRINQDLSLDKLCVK